VAQTVEFAKVCVNGLLLSLNLHTAKLLLFFFFFFFLLADENTTMLLE